MDLSRNTVEVVPAKEISRCENCLVCQALANLAKNNTGKTEVLIDDDKFHSVKQSSVDEVVTRTNVTGENHFSEARRRCPECRICQAIKQSEIVAAKPRCTDCLVCQNLELAENNERNRHHLIIKDVEKNSIGQIEEVVNRTKIMFDKYPVEVRKRCSNCLVCQATEVAENKEKKIEDYIQDSVQYSLAKDMVTQTVPCICKYAKRKGYDSVDRAEGLAKKIVGEFLEIVEGSIDEYPVETRMGCLKSSVEDKFVEEALIRTEAIIDECLVEENIKTVEGRKYHPVDLTEGISKTSVGEFLQFVECSVDEAVNQSAAIVREWLIADNIGLASGFEEMVRDAETVAKNSVVDFLKIVTTTVEDAVNNSEAAAKQKSVADRRRKSVRIRTDTLRNAEAEVKKIVSEFLDFVEGKVREAVNHVEVRSRQNIHQAGTVANESITGFLEFVEARAEEAVHHAEALIKECVVMECVGIAEGKYEKPVCRTEPEVKKTVLECLDCLDASIEKAMYHAEAIITENIVENTVGATNNAKTGSLEFVEARAEEAVHHAEALVKECVVMECVGIAEGKYEEPVCRTEPKVKKTVLECLDCLDANIEKAMYHAEAIITESIVEETVGATNNTNNVVSHVEDAVGMHKHHIKDEHEKLLKDSSSPTEVILKKVKARLEEEAFETEAKSKKNTGYILQVGEESRNLDTILENAGVEYTSEVTTNAEKVKQSADEKCATGFADEIGVEDEVSLIRNVEKAPNVLKKLITNTEDSACETSDYTIAQAKVADEEGIDVITQRDEPKGDIGAIGPWNEKNLLLNSVDCTNLGAEGYTSPVEDKALRDEDNHVNVADMPASLTKKGAHENKKNLSIGLVADSVQRTKGIFDLRNHVTKSAYDANAEAEIVSAGWSREVLEEAVEHTKGLAEKSWSIVAAAVSLSNSSSTVVSKELVNHTKRISEPKEGIGESAENTETSNDVFSNHEGKSEIVVEAKARLAKAAIYSASADKSKLIGLSAEHPEKAADICLPNADKSEIVGESTEHPKKAAVICLPNADKSEIVGGSSEHPKKAADICLPNADKSEIVGGSSEHPKKAADICLPNADKSELVGGSSEHPKKAADICLANADKSEIGGESAEHPEKAADICLPNADKSELVGGSSEHPKKAADICLANADKSEIGGESAEHPEKAANICLPNADKSEIVGESAEHPETAANICLPNADKSEIVGESAEHPEKAANICLPNADKSEIVGESAEHPEKAANICLPNADKSEIVGESAEHPETAANICLPNADKSEIVGESAEHPEKAANICLPNADKSEIVGESAEHPKEAADIDLANADKSEVVGESAERPEKAGEICSTDVKVSQSKDVDHVKGGVSKMASLANMDFADRQEHAASPANADTSHEDVLLAKSSGHTNLVAEKSEDLADENTLGADIPDIVTNVRSASVRGLNNYNILNVDKTTNLKKLIFAETNQCHKHDSDVSTSCTKVADVEFSSGSNDKNKSAFLYEDVVNSLTDNGRKEQRNHGKAVVVEKLDHNLHFPLQLNLQLQLQATVSQVEDLLMKAANCNKAKSERTVEPNKVVSAKQVSLNELDSTASEKHAEDSSIGSVQSTEPVESRPDETESHPQVMADDARPAIKLSNNLEELGLDNKDDNEHSPEESVGALIKSETTVETQEENETEEYASGSSGSRKVK